MQFIPKSLVNNETSGKQDVNLRSHGNRLQVPCLFIRPHIESDLFVSGGNELRSDLYNTRLRSSEVYGTYDIEHFASV